MARKPRSKGVCLFCGQEMAKGGLSRHLASCAKRQEAVARAKAGTDEALYHLQVQDAWGGDFWLHLEMRGGATLQELDEYLRGIWLECCGHMSRFSADGEWGQEIGMKRRADQVFKPKTELTHVYDFGTSSVMKIQVKGVRQGKPLSKRPIFLMARNLIPQVSCQECDAPAGWLCQECRIEEEMPGLLCEAHVRDHPHDDYGEPAPLVNSPRLGMCGYTGPAEPPY